MAKKIPNPNGKRGGKAHRDLIDKVEEDILKRNLDVDRETIIPLDKKNKRFADLTAIDKKTDLRIEIHQIGKQNKNGTPVKRERKAIEDIEKATGLKVIFHPYNIFILLIVLLISVAFYIS